MRWLKEPFDFLHVQLLAMRLADNFISRQNGCEIKKPIKTRFLFARLLPSSFGTQHEDGIFYKEKRYASLYQNQAFVVFGVNPFK